MAKEQAEKAMKVHQEDLAKIDSLNKKIDSMKESSMIVVHQKLQNEIKALMEEKQSLQNEQDTFNEKFSHANSQN